MQTVTQRLRLEDGTIKEFQINRYVPGEEQEIYDQIETMPEDRAHALESHLSEVTVEEVVETIEEVPLIPKSED